ncbi:hypothetical protein Pfo_008073 [Paulownia fortunei]|nr:hypothetical protein Pfo_008073 [Paulownia fortunei]
MLSKDGVFLRKLFLLEKNGISNLLYASNRLSGPPRPVLVAATSTLIANGVPPKNGVYTVGDFMTRKEDLHVVKSTTTVDEALEMLVENRITGFPVIDDDWKLVSFAFSFPSFKALLIIVSLQIEAVIVLEHYIYC